MQQLRSLNKPCGLLVVLVLVLSLAVGCVGPNKLKRSLDRKLQEGYVEHPLRSQLLFPVNFIFNHIAALTDLLILNPTYWWADVFRGQGTSFDEAVGESAEEDEEEVTPPDGEGS